MRNCTHALPPDMSFTFAVLLILLVYSFVFIVAFIGNFTMFLILLRNQLVKKRRMHGILLHMNIAHLMVTLVFMPKEILHNYMIAWNAGDLLCRVCRFFDVFGIALSANILICISLDRFYSIFFPMSSIRARRSIYQMVAISWLVSFITSAPQVYFLPLVVTLVCYSLILVRISSAGGTKKDYSKPCNTNSLTMDTTKSLRTNERILRRSTAGNLEKARSRTLKMTFVIVIAFLFCWTPYAIVMFLHFTSDLSWMPKEVRKLIYAFAVFNSAITPYLYGYFSFDVKKELRLLVLCSKASVSERHLSTSNAVANRCRTVNNSPHRKRSLSVSFAHERDSPKPPSDPPSCTGKSSLKKSRLSPIQREMNHLTTPNRRVS